MQLERGIREEGGGKGGGGVKSSRGREGAWRIRMLWLSD